MEMIFQFAAMRRGPKRIMELPLQEMRALHKLDVVFKCIQDLWLMPALQTQDSFRGTSILSLRKADVSARFELYI